MPAATNDISSGISDPSNESEEVHINQPIYLNQPICDQPERMGKFLIATFSSTKHLNTGVPPFASERDSVPVQDNDESENSKLYENHTT